MPEDFDEYKKILKRLAEKESEEFISNSSKVHASAMIEVLFRVAEGDVRILSDHLNSEVYGEPEVIAAAADFLKKEKSKLDVILQLREGEEKDLIDELGINAFLSAFKGQGNKISIYHAEKELKTFDHHFMVTKTDKGNYCIRYESNTKEHIATGTFNAGNFGKTLFDFFEKAKNGSSKPLPLQG